MCDCFKGTGEITIEERDLVDFEKIILEDNINLVIINDSVNKVTIEAGKKLLKLIKTDVNNNCLTISNNNKCNWVRSYEKGEINVFVSLKNLKILEYRGSGNITSLDTIKGNYFELNSWNGSGLINLSLDIGESWLSVHTGPADLNIRGRSGVNYLYHCGNGKVDCTNLVADYIFMYTSATNDCYVNVTKELEVTINYIGNVYYTGNPYSVKSKIWDDGRLIKID